VHADVSGYVSRVTVKQLFGNPFKDKIEAVYTFPLSDTGAVDDMTMRIGARTIHGTIKKREEARQIYEQAKNTGHVASLLDQERPNIFTQSVANIEPGKEVEVTLTYVDLLPYADGAYTFAFPTVVGPRFNPGNAAGKQGMGFSPDTNEVPDASKITPHVAPEGVRAGHDISINVSIDAAVPITDIHSQLHEIKVQKSAEHANVSLLDKETIPNKDFVLSWAVAADKLHSGYLTYGKNGEGYFTLMILPPKKATAEHIQPKEMIFLIDCSGSQSGRPLQKAKEAMEYSLDHMNPNDTFQVLSFNNSVTRLFEKPRPASDEMKRRAKIFVESLDAHGGTWMAQAVEAACKEPTDEHRLRIVSFMTDGFVGNDFEIVGMVRKLRENSRWFPFGTGNSVNRFLIDNIAKNGGGEADYVYLNSDAAEVGKKFYDKIASPVLTDVKVDFGGLNVKEVFPHEISDVWAQRPLYITGRYTKPGAGTVTVTGFSGGKAYKQTLAVNFPDNNASNAVLGSIWARAKVDRLMDEDNMGAQRGAVNAELKDEIVKVALEHHIMTQYTSFVAVEEKTVTKGGESKKVEVPVELPDGVSRKGVFGEASDELRSASTNSLSRGMPMGNFGRMASAPRTKAMKSQIAPSGSYNQYAPMATPAPMALQGATMGTIGGGAGGGGGAVSGQLMRQKVAMQPQSMAPPPPMVALSTTSVPKPSAVNMPIYGGAHQSAGMHQNYRHTSAKGYGGASASSAVLEPPHELSDKERSAATEKLSKELRELLKAKIETSDTRRGAVALKNGAAWVRIMVKDASEDGVAKLYVPGLTIDSVVFGDGVVYAWVDVNQLLQLAAHDNVLHVEQIAID
jgi:Ca-activated chloride channel family protein